MKIKKIYPHNLSKKEAERKILRAIRLSDMNGKLCVKGELLCTPYGTGGDKECLTIIIWIKVSTDLIVLDLRLPILNFGSRENLENMLDSSVAASLDGNQ